MKKFVRNRELRQVKGRIPNWVIAERLGVSENTLLRYWRTEMSPALASQIRNIINEINADAAKENASP